MRLLRDGVHARVGSSRPLQVGDVVAGGFADGPQEFTLHGARVLLDLPAAVSAFRHIRWSGDSEACSEGYHVAVMSPSRGRPPGHVSLNRALSKLGLASRAEATSLIRDGRVRLDGRVEIDPERAVVPERVRIDIDDAPAEAADWATIVFNKPRGVVTTRRDPQGRPTVFDVAKASPAGLVAAGRLDLATSGLLVLTTDTRLAAWITDPANGVPRVLRRHGPRRGGRRIGRTAGGRDRTRRRMSGGGRCPDSQTLAAGDAPDRSPDRRGGIARCVVCSTRWGMTSRG